jgi:hypothetical protein
VEQSSTRIHFIQEFPTTGDDGNMASGGDVRVKEATGAPCSDTGNRAFGIEARSGPVATNWGNGVSISDLVGGRGTSSWARNNVRTCLQHLVGGKQLEEAPVRALAVKQRVEGVESRRAPRRA